MLFWFTIFGCSLIGILAIGIILWTYGAIKQIVSTHPRNYTLATYYWICAVIIILGFSLILYFLFPLLGFTGWLLKEGVELVVKSFIY